MRLKLIRLTQDKNRLQKIGKLYVFEKFNELFSCYTLEPFECVPSGYYELEKYQSPKLKRQVLLFKDVPHRSFVEIHNGNFLSQTKLCVLVGENVTDINKDGLKDVTFSNRTLDKLLSLVPQVIQIDLFENPNEFNV